METKTTIAKAANISLQHFCNILSGRRRPSYRLAKRLASVTETTLFLWLEGTPKEINATLFDGKKKGG